MHAVKSSCPLVPIRSRKVCLGTMKKYKTHTAVTLDSQPKNRQGFYILITELIRGVGQEALPDLQSCTSESESQVVHNGQFKQCLVDFT